MAAHDANLHACVLAALILHDANIEITGDKIKTLLDASNNTSVQLVYCNIVAKFLAGKDVPAFLTQLATTAPLTNQKEDQDWDMIIDAGSSGDGDMICCSPGSDDSDDEAFCTLFD